MVRSYSSIKFSELSDGNKSGFAKIRSDYEPEVAEMLWDALIVRGKIQLSKTVLGLFMDDKDVKGLDEEGIADLLSTIMEKLKKVRGKDYAITNFKGKPILYWTVIRCFINIVENTESDKAPSMHILLRKMIVLLTENLGVEKTGLEDLIQDSDEEAESESEEEEAETPAKSAPPKEESGEEEAESPAKSAPPKEESGKEDADEEDSGEEEAESSAKSAPPKEESGKEDSGGEEETVRECRDCHLTKPINDFPEYKSYHATRCLPCHRAHRAMISQAHRAKKRALTVISDEGMGGVSCARCNKKTKQIKGKVCTPCHYEINKLNKSSLATGQRHCVSCTKVKDLSEFAKCVNGTIRNVCKSCYNLNRREKSKSKTPVAQV